MSQPLLSIITVNLNNNEGLIKTLNSIMQQSFVDYEHIIIDADSSDGSKSTILKYEKETSQPVYWVSEPDKGIYDGMNKGIKQARGEYLYFLNSGDQLEADVLRSVTFDGTKYICGNVKFVGLKESFEIVPPDEPDILFFLQTTLPHQGCFIHHSLFTQRNYDTHYKIISDWIHIMHSIVFAGCSYKHIPLLVVEYDGNGISTTQPEEVIRERSKWINENIPVYFLNSFTELSIYRNSELGAIIPLLSETKKFQKRVKKIILFLYRINSFFSRKNKRITEKQD